MNSSVPPPLAGLCTYEAGACPGLSVDTTVERLRRYVYLKSQLVFTMAAHFNAIAEWEVKGALSLHLWQDAEHSAWFRKRVTEMRTPPHHLDKVPDDALENFVEELKRSENTLELLIGIYEVLKPACLAAFREHLSQANKLADHPTLRCLRMVVAEEEEQIAWGQAALQSQLVREGCLPGDAALDAWRNHLRACLAAAGGVHGDQPRQEIGDASLSRRGRPFEINRVPRRDRRFANVWRSRGVVPGADRPVHERLWWMLNVRLQEMHVSELIASTLCDWQGQPWEFYHDLARHLWDETRHCMLGEIAFASQGIDFTSMPAHTGFAEYANSLPPADRYSFLWGIEQGLMGKTGKQAEVALAKAGGDELATMFQDFDWADEVLHAQIGRRWLESYYGSREAMNAAYSRVRPGYDAMKEEDLAQPGRDWWPSFYREHLQAKNPSLGAADEEGEGKAQTP